MEGDPVHVQGGLAVGEHLCRTVEHLLLVVVPDEGLHVVEPLRAQGGLQMLVEELALLTRAVEAGFPCLDGLRLVLHRHAADVHALGPVRGDRTGHHARPQVVHAAAQVPAVLHHVSGLRPRGRAPGGGYELEVGVDRLRSLDQGKHVGPVVVDGEALEGFVGLVHVRAGREGEIAALDGEPAEAVAVVLFGEAQLEEALLRGIVHLREHVSRRLGERGAEAQEGLVLDVRVHLHEVHLGGHRRRENLHVRFLEPAVAVGDVASHGAAFQLIAPPL